MKLVSFTVAAASLLVAGASLWRQHWLSERIARLELRVAATPPPVVIRFEEPPAPAVASLVPPPPIKHQPQRHARPRPATPQVALPTCNPTDPKCGLDP